MTDSRATGATNEERATLRTVRQALTSLHKILLDNEHTRSRGQ